MLGTVPWQERKSKYTYDMLNLQPWSSGQLLINRGQAKCPSLHHVMYNLYIYTNVVCVCVCVCV